MKTELIKHGEYYNTLTDTFSICTNNKDLDKDVFDEILKNCDTIVEFENYMDFTIDKRFRNDKVNKIIGVKIDTHHSSNDITPKHSFRYFFQFQSMDVLENFLLKHTDCTSVYTTLTIRCKCSYDKDFWFPSR